MIGANRGADLGAASGQQLQHRPRHAGLVHQVDGEGRDQAGLLGRLGDDAVSGRQRGQYLAAEYRQREIPRRDARDHAARCAPLVGHFCLAGVIVREIHRLAQFADGVEPGFPGLARQQRKQLGGIFLVQRGDALQAGGAFRDRGLRPVGKRRGGLGDSLIDARAVGVEHLPDPVRGIRRVDHFAAPGAIDRACRKRFRLPVFTGEQFAPRVQRVQRIQVGDIPAARIRSSGAVKLRRRRNPGIVDPRQFRDHGQRIASDRFRCNTGIDDLVDEGTVGAVFQQAAHQVSEQVLVFAHRRVDTATGLVLAHDEVVQRFAHAVQPLKLVSLTVRRQFQHRGDRVRIVCRELRVDAVGHRQQFACAGDIGQVGIDLAREYRVTGKAQHLRALDFGIPVGALDQAHHDPAVETRGQRVQPVEHGRRALAECLHDHAETVPATQRRVGEHGFDHVQRNVQAIGFLGVDIETHVGRRSQHCQRFHPRHQFIHDPRVLADFVTRMQRGKLYRDAGIIARVGVHAGAGQSGDRVRISQVVTAGVGPGAGGFAEHVVGIGITLLLQFARALAGAFDAGAEHEMPPHLAHGLGHRAAHQRLAQPLDHLVQGQAQPGFVFGRDDLAGQQQCPGRGIDQRRPGVAEVFAPVARRNLVLDQVVDGGIVRHAQQRFREAHQGHALAGSEAVLGKKIFHHARIRAGAYPAHEIRRHFADAFALLQGERRRGAQAVDDLRLVGQVKIANPGANRILG